MDNKQRTILIADDAEINRDLLRMLFENDYNIIEASNGEEAIEALASNKDHIATLFLDLVMPKKIQRACYYGYRRSHRRYRS